MRAKDKTQMIEEMASMEEIRQDRLRRSAGVMALALQMFGALMENRFERVGRSIFACRRHDEQRDDGQLIR